MRPLETNYREVVFKSRLEARWAVFFDALDIGWQYEPRTFNCGPLGRYTPDLLLDGELFAEVKPEWPTRWEVDKCRAVAPEAGGEVLLLIGRPDFQHYWTVSKNEERLVVVWDGCDLCASAPMNTLANPFQFTQRYHMAVDAAIAARFDGYDDDRQKAQRRYR